MGVCKTNAVVLKMQTVYWSASNDCRNGTGLSLIAGTGKVLDVAQSTVVGATAGVQVLGAWEAVSHARHPRHGPGGPPGLSASPRAGAHALPPCRGCLSPPGPAAAGCCSGGALRSPLHAGRALPNLLTGACPRVSNGILMHTRVLHGVFVRTHADSSRCKSLTSYESMCQCQSLQTRPDTTTSNMSRSHTKVRHGNAVSKDV